MTFELKIRQFEDHAEIALLGNIDEETDFDRVTLPETSHLVFNFEKVRAINSMGLRNWVRWMRQLADFRITFENCPHQVVRQINSLDGFLPQGARVVSFYVPLECDSCFNDESILVKLGDDYDYTEESIAKLTMISNGRRCSTCEDPLEIATMVQSYFGFLSRN